MKHPFFDKVTAISQNSVEWYIHLIRHSISKEFNFSTQDNRSFNALIAGKKVTLLHRGDQKDAQIFVPKKSNKTTAQFAYGAGSTQ